MTEPYKGQVRWYAETCQITSNDIRKVQSELGISLGLAKKLIQEELKQPKLQQFDGQAWIDVDYEYINVIVDIDKVIEKY